MTRLKIIGDPADAALHLKTNRPLRPGQEIVHPNEATLRTLAALHPETFQLIEDAPAHRPTQNKMLQKSRRVRTK